MLNQFLIKVLIKKMTNNNVKINIPTIDSIWDESDVAETIR